MHKYVTKTHGYSLIIYVGIYKYKLYLMATLHLLQELHIRNLGVKGSANPIQATTIT